MSIRIADRADHRRWDAFVDAHPQGSPFHDWSWSQCLVDSLGHDPRHLLAERDGDIAGVLPLVEVRSALTGVRLLSTPLAGYGGPLAHEESVASELVVRATELAHDRGADYLGLHFSDEEFVPAAAAGFRRGTQHAGFRTELPHDADDLMAWLPRTTRRMVRLGIKAGLRGEALALDPAAASVQAAELTAPDLDAAYALVMRTLRDLGTPAYPRALMEGLLHDPAWFLWVTRDHQHMVGAVWVARRGNCLFPHFSGADPGYRSVGISNLLYFELMRFGVVSGAPVFDFGRSKVDSGPYHFKRHCGFEPRPLGYRYYACNGRHPDVSPDSPRYRSAVALWQRLPLPVANTVGPRLLRHFV